MSKLVILFGPPAVGKMTVGQQLAELTGFKLFHNHMTIELALNFFAFNTKEFSHLNELFRSEIFSTVAASELPGLIFTYVWALNEPSDKTYVDGIAKPFPPSWRDGCAIHLDIYSTASVAASALIGNTRACCEKADIRPLRLTPLRALGNLEPPPAYLRIRRPEGSKGRLAGGPIRCR
jgi:AAA domain